MQALGRHLAPFFHALSDAISAEGDTAGSLAMLVLVRALLIGSFILAVYAFSRIVNALVGREIVIEQVIVVEEEDDDGDDDDPNNTDGGSGQKKIKMTRKVSRGKKQK